MKTMILFEVKSDNFPTRYITAHERSVAIDTYKKIYPSSTIIIPKELCERDEIIPTLDPKKEFESGMENEKYDTLKRAFYETAPMSKTA